MMLANAGVLRGQITVSHGANIAVGAYSAVNAAFNGAAVGDSVVCVPATLPPASVAVVQSPTVTTAGSVTAVAVNLGTATVSYGTAVVYNVWVFKATGQASQ